MTLRINDMYYYAGGYLTPRSHYSEGKSGEQYAIVQLTEQLGNRFVTRTTTMTSREIKVHLGIEKKREKIEIV